MGKISGELRAKLMKAQSAEEAAELMKELPEADPERVWEEIARHREDAGAELSLEELDAVSGGADRDFMTDGCAATVEAESDCWGTDMCCLFPVTYDHEPSEHKCPRCGGTLCYWDTIWRGISNKARYRCNACHGLFTHDEWTGTMIPVIELGQ